MKAIKETCECEMKLPEDYQTDDVCVRCKTYIRCVPLDLIDIPPIWSAPRAEDIRKWADRETLNSIIVDFSSFMDVCVSEDRLPRLSREKGGKYTIGNGIHRANVAKELGLQCILAVVTDCPEIDCKEAIIEKEFDRK